MGFPIMNGKSKTSKLGFTLIELLVVMSIIASLLTLAYPKFITSVDKSKDSALRHDLSTMRDALDKFYSDKGFYPESLTELVSLRYLRAIPPDPITESDQTWILLPSPEASHPGIFDIKSGADGNALDGTPYSEL